MVSVLDSFFLINLGVLSLITLCNKFNQISDGAQNAIICVSMWSVFAVFCLILLYHCLKKLGVLAAISKHHPLPPRVHARPLLEEFDNHEVDSDDVLLNVIDEGCFSDPQIMPASSLTQQGQSRHINT